MSPMSATGRRTDQYAAVPGPRQEAPLADGRTSPALTLLVIGEDPAGAFTVPDLLDVSGTRVRIRRARNLTEAERLLRDDVNCILLELAARSAEGAPDPMEGLRKLLQLAPRTAVLVLTAGADTDAERAAEAVRVGAQDHLTPADLDPSHLTRAIRYAVERKRADVAQRQLTETRLLAQENSRLERGLLPTPLLHGADLRFAARYRPGRSRALLGGDFYDTVRTPDGVVHAMIGDVCGHGPDEAALGVELRIAWRALTLAGLCGADLLGTLQQVLEHERSDAEIFATLCQVDISPDCRAADLWLAGHPAPLVSLSGMAPQLLPYEHGGPALGLLPQKDCWEAARFELGEAWSLMLYTDGLIEGRIGLGAQRLGQEGMVELVGRQLSAGLAGEDLLDAAMAEVRELNGGELTDDVALMLLESGA